MECNEVQMTITAIWTPSPDSSQAARTMAYYTYNGECSLVRIETKSFILAQKTQYPERRCSPKRVICTVAPKLPTKRNI